MGVAASQIFIPTILATLASTITAIVMVKLLEGLKVFSVENAS
jgi:spore maturation protein SpmA